MVLISGTGPPLRRGLWEKVLGRLRGLQDRARIFGELAGAVAAKVIDGRLPDGGRLVDGGRRYPIDPKGRTDIIGGGGYASLLQIVFRGTRHVSELAIMVRQHVAPGIAIYMRQTSNPQLICGT